MAMMYPRGDYQIEGGRLDSEIKELRKEVKELKEQLEIFQSFMKKNSFMDFKILKLNDELESKKREEMSRESTFLGLHANILRQMIR